MDRVEREMTIALYTVSAIVKDLLEGSIDTALYELYTTNHWTIQADYDMATHLSEIFRTLIYQPLDLCVRSNNCISIVHRRCNWWIQASNLSDNTIMLLTVLRSKHYNAFRNTSNYQGIGAFQVWSGFLHENVLQNALLTLERRLLANGLSEPVMSARAVICERMLYIILLVNSAYTSRSTEQHSEVWDNTVAFVKRALARLSVENYIQGNAETPVLGVRAVEPTETMKDTSAWIHRRLNRLLDDENKLYECTMQFYESQFRVSPDAMASAEASPASPTEPAHQASVVEEVE